MQPNDTPAISRYNAQLTYNGTNWIGVEQFNTLGAVTIPAQPSPELESIGLFKANKTTVTCTSYKNGAVQTAHLVDFTINTMTWYMEGAAANGDKLLIQVEVFNQ